MNTKIKNKAALQDYLSMRIAGFLVLALTFLCPKDSEAYVVEYINGEAVGYDIRTGSIDFWTRYCTFPVGSRMLNDLWKVRDSYNRIFEQMGVDFTISSFSKPCSEPVSFSDSKGEIFYSADVSYFAPYDSNGDGIKNAHQANAVAHVRKEIGVDGKVRLKSVDLGINYHLSVSNDLLLQHVYRNAYSVDYDNFFSRGYGGAYKNHYGVYPYPNVISQSRSTHMFAHTAAHEMLHALGLWHPEVNETILNTNHLNSTSVAYYRDDQIRANNDDLKGLTHLYGMDLDINLAMTNVQLRAGNQIAANGESYPVTYENHAPNGFADILTCPCKYINLKWNMSNMGNSHTGYKVSFYLSEDKYITFGTYEDRRLGGYYPNVNLSKDRFSSDFLDYNVRVPCNQPHGKTYNIGAVLDPFDDISESNEDDNVIFFRSKLKLKEASQCN